MIEAEVIKPHSIKLVSWDIDGTLYSIPGMKCHLLGSLLREVSKGRGLVARRELAMLKHHRDMIDAARLTGGTLDETPQKQKSRDLLLSVESVGTSCDSENWKRDRSCESSLLLDSRMSRRL